MIQLGLLAECSKAIGSGHVVETLNLSRALRGIRWKAYISQTAPKNLTPLFKGKVERVSVFSDRTFARIANAGCKAVLFNSLTVAPAQTCAAAKAGLRVACITASGPRPENCGFWIDLDIGNPGNSQGDLSGTAHMILDKRFERLATSRRKHEGPLKNLMIIMGGTDNSGCSVALAKALAHQLPQVRKSIIAGPNFAKLPELRRTLAALADPTLVLVQSPKNLPLLMKKADAAFTLGSDTSLELAAAGTPTILMQECPHELRQARFLARGGCGFFLGNVKKAIPRLILPLLSSLESPTKRQKIAKKSKKIVDGRGAARVAKALSQWLKGQ